MGLLRKLQYVLPRPSLITIYKLSVRPLLDYVNIIYNHVYNNSFHQKMETVQYNTALAITGAIRGSSMEKLQQELGLDSLQERRWYRKLCLLYKILKKKSPNHLFKLVPVPKARHRTTNCHKIPTFNAKDDFFKNSFFPSTINKWIKLNPNFQNS